uniref:TdIF1 C-terminal domain-containing protein n=1 Tax=Glossina pallidipes TaxID=7398 RepID=A0A1B0A5T4_GLOPL
MKYNFIENFKFVLFGMQTNRWINTDFNVVGQFSGLPYLGSQLSRIGQRLASSENFFSRLKQRLQQTCILISRETLPRPSVEMNLEDIRCRVQVTFDQHISAFSRKFLEKHCRLSLDELHLIWGEEFFSKGIPKRLLIRLLENTIKHLKTQLSKQCGQRHSSQQFSSIPEIVINGVNGTYRPLNKDFDVTFPVQQFYKRPPVGRKVFWDLNSISNTTRFVLETEVNDIFRLGPKRKQRLVSKNAHLIRYLPDAEDRQWLKSECLLDQNNADSRILLLSFEQVRDLPNVCKLYRKFKDPDLLADVKSFTVPEFMVKKIRLIFIRIQIKSDGAITTVPIKSLDEKENLSEKSLSNAESTPPYNSSSLPSSVTSQISSSSLLKTNECSSTSHLNVNKEITHTPAKSTQGYSLFNLSHLVFGAHLTNSSDPNCGQQLPL